MLNGSGSTEASTPTSIGPYRVIAPLGSGTTAEVFLAVQDGQVHFPKLYAVKVLRPEVSADPVARSAFVTEAHLSARFYHQNLVSSHDVGTTDDGRLFVAMNYREGQPLSDVVRAARDAKFSVSFDTWASVVAQVLAGLHYAHEMRDYDGRRLCVVHRDVNPDNVLVGYDGHVSLIDFGVALTTSHLSSADTAILKGRMGYMAPEYLEGRRVDRRADIFSTGVLLWELCAGRSLTAVREPHFFSSKPLPRLRAIVPQIPPELDAIVARALERDARRRYASAKDMREALEIYLSKRQCNGTDILGEVVDRLFSAPRATLGSAVMATVASMERESSDVLQVTGVRDLLDRPDVIAEVGAGVRGGRRPSPSQIYEAPPSRVRGDRGGDEGTRLFPERSSRYA